ncbi:hypothetical protein [Solitalea lacus]|uniref:hypothetical protein n=1 Tax=Solitalea lacus TaxID=2911172 RepID=UPI001EDAD256|nr:hypothetical protein [Solitalea lacus]UKJ07877.1 hypothetical protein L2B55_01620 [Solitalea lacus]
MIKLTTKIENIEQLRAERARLKTLADAKEEELNLQFRAINEKLKPIQKALGFFTKGEDGGAMGSALISGAKSLLPYLLSGLLTGRKRGFFGAATAVGGDLLFKNLKNVDISKISDFIGNIFKSKKKIDKPGDEPIDWEHEIYT